MTETYDELSFSQEVDANPEDVFYAFTTAQGWRNWMCDSARFEARPGGSYQLAWNSGWYASGTVREITRPEKVALTWFGMGDPGPTDVTIKLKEKAGQTLVELSHSGFGQKGDWAETREEAIKGWENGLENLVSTFNTGEDLRVVRRPMLGIMLNDFDEKVAKELGVPVEKGIRIERSIEGMGAERAGLQPNDVIVEFGGSAIRGFTDLGNVLEGKQAGDVVSVTVYRGPEKVTVDMDLSQRPLMEIPLDPGAIAERLRPVHAKMMKDLRGLLDGVSEAEAEFKPTSEEWSVKETLAHLIVSEHWFQHWLVEVINDGEREFSEQGGNQIAQLTALLSVSPTLQELLDRFERCMEESQALLTRAEALKKRKGVLWRFGQDVLQYPDFHERSHMEQMQATIEAARTG